MGKWLQDFQYLKGKGEYSDDKQHKQPGTRSGEIKQFTGPDINLQEKWSAGIRTMLKEFTDYYFEALTAHNPAKLHFARCKVHGKRCY